MTAAPRYRQNPDVSETQVDDDLFLVEPESQEIFFLDPVGAALWRLIAEPKTLEEAVAVYSAAFPDTDAGVVETDIRAALENLLERRLALTVP